MKLQHSYSRIRQFEECPLKYKKSFIDKIPVERGLPLLVGAAIHDGIAEYSEICIRAGKESFFEKWEEVANRAIENHRVPESEEEQVRKAIRGYAEQREIPLDSVYGVEQRFSVNRDLEECGWMAEDVYFRGVIDLLQIKDNSARITDYKSGYVINNDKFQLEIYAWLVNKMFPHITNFEIVIDYIRHDLQSEAFITIDQIPSIEEKIKRKCDTIEAEKKFKPTTNSGCEYCGYAGVCPLMKSRGAENYPAPQTREEAEELAKRYIELDITRKEIQKQLRKWIDGAGSVVGGGKELSIKSTERRTVIDPEGMIEAFNEAGIYITPYLRLDTRKAKMLLESEEARAIYEAYTKVSVYSRWSEVIYRGEEEDEAEE